MTLTGVPKLHYIAFGIEGPKTPYAAALVEELGRELKRAVPLLHKHTSRHRTVQSCFIDIFQPEDHLE